MSSELFEMSDQGFARSALGRMYNGPRNYKREQDLNLVLCQQS